MRGGFSWVWRTRYQDPQHSHARKACAGIPRFIRILRINPIAHGPTTADGPLESAALVLRPRNLEIESEVVISLKHLTRCQRLEH